MHALLIALVLGIAGVFVGRSPLCARRSLPRRDRPTVRGPDRPAAPARSTAAEAALRAKLRRKPPAPAAAPAAAAPKVVYTARRRASPS